MVNVWGDMGSGGFLLLGAEPRQPHRSVVHSGSCVKSGTTARSPQTAAWLRMAPAMRLQRGKGATDDG